MQYVFGIHSPGLFLKPVCLQRTCKMPMCAEEVSDCTYILAYCTQSVDNSRELRCMTDDQNTGCWLVLPVLRQAPARKYMFQASQRVHRGAHGTKGTHIPSSQQYSNTVIWQCHYFPYIFMLSGASVHYRSVWRQVCVENAPPPMKGWQYFVSSWASPVSFFRSMLSATTQL